MRKFIVNSFVVNLIAAHPLVCITIFVSLLAHPDAHPAASGEFLLRDVMISRCEGNSALVSFVVAATTLIMIRGAWNDSGHGRF